MGPSGDRYVTLPVGHQKLRIRYVTAGGAGHPVLLLHGFGGSADHWRLVMPALARHFRVYAIDLPGFGRSERPGRGFHISDLSQAAGAFIKAFGLSSLRVAGHSMGGQIAVEVARMHQTRVDRLVVIDSSGLNPRPLSTAIRMMLRFPTLGWMWSRVVATEPVFRRRLRFLAADESRLTEADRKTLRQGILQVRLPASRGEAWAFERFLDRVGQVSCPALVLWGARDRLLPVEHGVAIFKHLQDGRLQVIDDCGHVMPLERPEELAKVLAGFFE